MGYVKMRQILSEIDRRSLTRRASVPWPFSSGGGGQGGHDAFRSAAVLLRPRRGQDAVTDRQPLRLS